MNKKSVLFLLCAFSVGFSLFSQAMFNDNPSGEERQKLADGEILTEYRIMTVSFFIR